MMMPLRSWPSPQTTRAKPLRLADHSALDDFANAPIEGAGQNDSVKPFLSLRSFTFLVLLGLCATSLAGCALSIGATNSPSPPNAGSGPSSDRR
jgi:hypothetical protein